MHAQFKPACACIMATRAGWFLRAQAEGSLSHYFSIIGERGPSRKRYKMQCLQPFSIFVSPQWIRIKLPHYLSLRHASSGPGPNLPLLDEMSSQQDIPQKNLCKNPRIGLFFSPLLNHTL